jgi:tRNA(Arg) A34 adenosine deaminase TadA
MNFTIALEEALKSNMRIKHGAVIMRGKKIVARGHNHVRGKYAIHNFCSSHAERDAIMRFLAQHNALKDWWKPYRLL